MATYGMFPRDGHEFSAAEVAKALGGLIQRDEDGIPVSGFIGSPSVSVVPSTWNLLVGPLAHVSENDGGVAFSGISSDEMVTVDSATGIPAGQSRRDVVCWDVDAAELIVVKGTPGLVPEVPDTDDLAPIADVLVKAGDSMLIGAQVELGFYQTALAVDQPAVVRGSVSPRAVNAGGVTRVPVAFAPGAFAAPPTVVATVTGGIRDVNASIESVTKDGFKLVLGSMSTVKRTFGATWIAAS